MMNKNIDLRNLQLTVHRLTDEFVYDYPVSEAAQAALEETGAWLGKSPAVAIEQAKHYIAVYPHIPIFWNLLHSGYIAVDDMEAAYEVALQERKKFPNYLYGKLDVAQHCLWRKDFKGFEAIFSTGFDLKAILPHREKFHHSEALGVFVIVAQYYEAIGNTDQADMYLNIISEMRPEHPVLELIFNKRMAGALERMQARIAKANRGSRLRKRSIFG